MAEAMVKRRRREWGSALPLWRQLVDAAPAEDSWRARLVECAARLDQVSLAERQVAALAIRSTSRNRPALLDAAEALIERGALDAAATILDGMGPDPLREARRLFLIGRVLQFRRQAGRAAQAYRASIAAGDFRGRAAHALAQLRQPARDPEAPLADWDKTSAAQPMELGRLLEEMGERATLSRAAEMAAVQAEAHHARARQLAAKGDTQGRIAELREALTHQPERKRARRELARALLSERRWEEAAQEWAALRPADGHLDAEILSSLGRAYLNLGRPEAAGRAYSILLAQEPASLPAAVGLARSLAALPSRGEELTAWRRVLARNPGHPEATLAQLRLELAAARATTGFGGDAHLDEAEARLRGLSLLHPARTELRVELARMAARRRGAGAAEAEWRSVLALAPAHREAQRALSDLLVGSGREHEALALWADGLQREPGFAEAHLRAGRIKAKLGDRDGAEAEFRAAHAKESGRASFLAQLVQHLSGAADTRAEAAALIRHWRELEPANPEPLLREAHLLERIGRTDQAEAVLGEAIAIAPGEPRARASLTQFMQRRRRWDEAVRAAEAWAVLLPGEAEPALMRIEALTELGRSNEVEEAFRLLHEQHPDNFAALMGLARANRRRGQLNEACRLWRRAAALRPELEEPWLRLVSSLANADREPEAMAAFAEADAALAQDGAGTLARANIMDSSRFLDRAQAYYVAAAELLPEDPRPFRAFGRSLAREGVLDDALRQLAVARGLDPASPDLARELAEVAELLDYLGYDVLDVAGRKPAAALATPAIARRPILVPEELFARAMAEITTRDASYNPVPGRVLLANQSLGAGGAERQLVTTIRGLSRPEMGLERLDLLCRSLDPVTGRDFYCPHVERTGATIVVPTAEEIAASGEDPFVRGLGRLLERLPEDMGPVGHWIAELRRRRPAVVHAWQDMTALSVGLAAALAGVPRILLGTRSVRPDNPRRRLRRWMHAAYGQLLMLPNVRMVNNSQAGADDYEAWLGLPAGTVHVIYNGMDFDSLGQDTDKDASARLKLDLGIPAKAPVMGGVFRMSEEKRPLLWVETAREVLMALPDAYFVVCGDGPMAPEMRAYAEAHGFADRLNMPGNKSRIALWYGLMDTVLLSSRHEGLPNVLMEAEALGIPVVAPRVGGTAEVLEEGVTGFAVPDANAKLLADKVVRCLSDRKWRRRARTRAPEYVRGKFGIDRMLIRTLEEYGPGVTRDG